MINLIPISFSIFWARRTLSLSLTSIILGKLLFLFIADKERLVSLIFPELVEYQLASKKDCFNKATAPISELGYLCLVDPFIKEK